VIGISGKGQIESGPADGVGKGMAYPKNIIPRDGQEEQKFNVD
jgi:hypothetical protein